MFNNSILQLDPNTLAHYVKGDKSIILLLTDLKQKRSITITATQAIADVEGAWLRGILSKRN